MAKLDRNEPISVSSISREIDMSSFSDVIVQGDSYSTVITFKFDNDFENMIDLDNESTMVRVVYTLPNGDTSMQDLEKDSDSYNYSWIIEDYIAQRAGTVVFLVEVYDEDSAISWNSLPSELKIRDRKVGAVADSVLYEATSVEKRLLLLEEELQKLKEIVEKEHPQEV